MEQTLKELLTEQGIKLEPQTPPGKTVSTLIQRGWNLIFGRKGTFLYPVHVERLGGLMVMPFEGLVTPDNEYRTTMNSSVVDVTWDLVTAHPRITEIKTTQNLVASPFTLSGAEYLEVIDGPAVGGVTIDHIPGGCHSAWVFTTSRYLSFTFSPTGAVELVIGVRSWDL